MELNTLSKITCYSRKLSLKNFINKNNKVTLIFSKKDYNDYDFIEVIIKNTKNKEEFTCPFTINSSNSITIDLSDIYLYFTDYEGSISIVAKCDNTFFSITPILLKENLTIINDFQKTNYKLFIRTLENGELRNIYLIDKDNIHNNSVQVINQYEVETDKRKNRYDVTILVNGFPIVNTTYNLLICIKINFI